MTAGVEDWHVEDPVTLALTDRDYLSVDQIVIASRVQERAMIVAPEDLWCAVDVPYSEIEERPSLEVVENRPEPSPPAIPDTATRLYNRLWVSAMVGNEQREHIRRGPSRVCIAEAEASGLR